jgi:hypothetical protein
MQVYPTLRLSLLVITLYFQEAEGPELSWSCPCFLGMLGLGVSFLTLVIALCSIVLTLNDTRHLESLVSFLSLM